jgi:hypothetical protein
MIVAVSGKAQNVHLPIPISGCSQYWNICKSPVNNHQYMTKKGLSPPSIHLKSFHA